MSLQCACNSRLCIDNTSVKQFILNLLTQIRYKPVADAVIVVQGCIVHY
jgi:hypothetical protein